MNLTVSDLGEHALIARIGDRVPTAAPGLVVGIGDDAAVVEPQRGEMTVVTTDALVEGVHFDRALSSAADIGHRALAVNLSDLAAMGAVPRQALLSLALPPALPLSDFDQLVDTFLALAARHRTAVVGGNITTSGRDGPLFVDVTAIGSVKRRRILARAGARVGDIVYCSGTLGAAAAGLAALRQAHDQGATADESAIGECLQRHRRPEPRVRLGTALGRNRAAGSCIDISDGFADAVHQLARDSNVGIRIDAEALPIHPAAHAWFSAAGVDPVTAAIGDSDDYELVFTAPADFRGRLRHVRRQMGDVGITPVGVVTGDRDIVLRRDGTDEPLRGGYEHLT